MPNPKKLAILISGQGSNMVSICRHFCNSSIARVDLVLSNNPQAPGLEFAKQLGVQTKIVDHKSFATRAKFDEALAKALTESKVDMVILAGFMRVLGADLVNKWSGRMLNIHPSLLPSFKGAHAVKDAIDYGVKITGTTVHLVSADVDCGPILAQQAVLVSPGETQSSLHEKIKLVEQQLYPLVIEEYAKTLR